MSLRAVNGPILVTGATGMQGGAVVRAARARGHRVRAFVGSTWGPTRRRDRRLAAAIAAARGRPVRYEAAPLGDDDGDMTRMWRWFGEVGYAADLAGLRASFPEVPWSSFSAWAAAVRW